MIFFLIANEGGKFRVLQWTSAATASLPVLCFGLSVGGGL